MSTSTIKHVPCETADEFINAISLRGPYFRSLANHETLIFRGHCLSEWKLVPSALREANRDELHKFAQTSSDVRDRKNTHIAQVIAELTILASFEQSLDRSGLFVPNAPCSISELLHQYETDLRNGENHTTAMHPLLAFKELMSLAQHYGLHTRLLDWTRSPFFAAYFAAAETPCSQECRASVWALHSRDNYITARDGSQNLRIITIPRSINPYFHAQDGVFTLYTADGMRIKNDDVIDARPMEDAIKGFNKSAEHPAEHTFLYHFTFPRTETGKILWLLEKEGVNASKLFPGHAGVVRSVKERWLSERPL